MCKRAKEEGELLIDVCPACPVARIAVGPQIRRFQQFLRLPQVEGLPFDHTHSFTKDQRWLKSFDEFRKKKLWDRSSFVEQFYSIDNGLYLNLLPKLVKNSLVGLFAGVSPQYVSKKAPATFCDICGQCFVFNLTWEDS